jgi:glycine dehydrogenase subunit 2
VSSQECFIHAYHGSRENPKKIIVPDTAHGTNPASAALCGYEPVPVSSDEKGILPVESVDRLMDEETAGIMITNPNTLGLFEENIKKIADIVHTRGGLVYGDGANMNAVMGIIDPKEMGIDVLHLNLHKTFSTPHGGPGSAVCVEKTRTFLPVPRIVEKGLSYSSRGFPIRSEDFLLRKFWCCKSLQLYSLMSENNQRLASCRPMQLPQKA